MAKFNASSIGTNTTVNKSGAMAYKMPEKTELVNAVLTSFFGENKFYGSTNNRIVNLATKLVDESPEFVANLTLFARKEFNLRSVSHVLTAIMAHSIPGKRLTRDLVNRVVVRADDITEILSAYISLYSKPIPNSLKKGLNDALLRQNEYSLAKYKGSTKTLKMRDVPRITHPLPKTPEQSELLRKLIADELETPYTWETELSAKGNTKEIWEELIDSGKVGYMAILRNLRNIIKAGVSKNHLDKVLTKIANPEEVKKSKQLPFRFFAAYKELKGMPGTTSKITNSLESAISSAIVNMPALSGTTAICIDVSGSMTSRCLNKSDITCGEIAALLGIMLSQTCEDSITLAFDTSAKKITLSNTGGILSQMSKISMLGGGTDITASIRYLTDNNIKVDRIVMLSDNEMNHWGYRSAQSYLDKYRKNVNNNCYVHAVDMQGYGTQQFIGKDVNLVAGWSEKIIEFVSLVEAGTAGLVSKIDTYHYE